jgi:PAS domain S-box-containing protein
MSTTSANPQGEEKARPAAAAERVNILLVDDDIRNLDVLESVLQNPGYNLVRALSAEGALMMLLEREFAVIVLDVQMPGMNGIELANVIKQRKRTQHIPIIFLTSYYQDEKDVLEGYGSGAVDYLTKPINTRILQSKIAVLVDLHRATRALVETNTALEQQVAQRQKAEEALVKANSELETRVGARTAELLDANEELRRREAALRDSEMQLRLITDHAPVFLIQCDREHRLKFANRTFAERFGYEPFQLVGMHIAKVIGDSAYEAFRHHIDATLDGRRIEFESELAHPSFGSRWVHVVQEPERSPEGEVVGLVAVMGDVTERKLVEREIVLTRDKALAASRAKDDFLARLSHELRTPLNPVLLLASDAANNRKLSDDVRADFETIAQNVALEARLIDDLLDLSRIAHGKLVLELRPFDVHTILREAVAMLQAETSQKNLTVSLRLEAQRHVVLCDDVRLKQVFWNVLKNAVKFTPDSGRIGVETSWVQESDMLAIKITDSGIGISQDEMTRIFAPFSQGDHSANIGGAQFGGLGLGLVIAKMLMEQHSGYISAISTGRNKGSTFLIELPLFQDKIKDASRPPSSTPQKSLSPEEPAEGLPFRRILLVEDHKPTRSALMRLLERRKYDTVGVGTISEALAAAEKEAPFDLLISDIGLPDGNGYDLMTTLRDRYGVIGIALTGYGTDEDVDRSQAAGFSGHLTKPVSVQGLDCALASANRIAGAKGVTNAAEPGH